MKRHTILWLLSLGTIAIFIAINCSGGSDSPLSPDMNEPERASLGGTISLGTPELNGDEISYPVEFTEADDLYALSFRVGFVQEQLVPIGIEWSEEVGEEDSTFHLLDQDGFIPLAFSRYAPIRGLDGNGRLCVLRFRIIGAELSQPWIISDEDFLVARDSIGRRLRLRVGGEGR